MKKIVSVIVPIYNVEKYIRECLDSIVGQTYNELQIILVDDGSTDNSGIICDEYAAKDERITVVHQHNQGAGAAKNSGLELVRGEYLSLIDGDDYLDLRFYEVMIEMLEKHKADVVQCLFDNCFKERAIARQYHFPSSRERKMNTKRFLFELLYDWKYAIFANKVFKTEMLGQIRFPVGRKIDDEFFTYKIMCNGKKVVNINDHLYHYRMRKSSVMNANDTMKLNQDRLECFRERYEYVSNKFPSLREAYYLHLSNNFAELYPCKKENALHKVKRRIQLCSYVGNFGEKIVGEYYE